MSMIQCYLQFMVYNIHKTVSVIERDAEAHSSNYYDLLVVAIDQKF